ncbi:hypothetical protein [Blastomonas sp. AAP53]|uniref:hypothetical protein n=1 Tax=Blastomonas sp. AAP53 TaxID=1248760 RepID=UPI00035E5E8B|nr:hypothetical protein [Blastomonas sp. AAP53]
MRSISLAVGVAIVAIATPIVPISAKDPSPQKLMDMAAGCAYVVSIAEGNNVKLRYGSADWMNVIRQLERVTGLDGEQSLKLAKAKYNKRARVMGADEALSHMKSRSKDCDREMAVIQS